MFRSMFTVGGFTLMSRILGLARDKLIATYIGSGALGDVWVAAFRLPNLFRRVFGEGAFNAAFVPMYSRRIEEDGDEVADKFAMRTMSLMALILAVLFVLAFIFMDPLTRIMNPGYAGDGRLEPAVAASKVTIVYMIFVCLMAALAGVLNSRRSFAAPAFAYVVLNIVFLAGLLFVIPKTGEPLKVLTWCVVAAGVLQILVVFIACLRIGVNLKLRLPVIDDDMKRLGLLMTPGLFSAGVQQLNLIVGQAVASLQMGGQVVIYYADRINQLPLGLIGISAGVVLLPEITRNLRAGNEGKAKSSMAKGVEMSLLLCLPAMVAMLVIPGEIMHALFQGGEFKAEGASLSGYALRAFAIGTPSYVLARVFQPAYFAQENTRTPMQFTIVSALVNVALVWPLFKIMGATGCALATSIAGWVNIVLLVGGLKKQHFLKMAPGFYSRMFRMFLSAALMGLAVWWLADLGNEWLMTEGRFFRRMTALVILVSLGAGVYFFFIFATRVFTIGELKRSLRRGR